LPNIPETYVHRIGRTGRAGNRGAAYSFCNAEEKAYLRDIEKLIARKIPVIEEHPFPMMNFDVEPPKPAAKQTTTKKVNTGHREPKPKQPQPHKPADPGTKSSERKRRFFGKRS